MDLHYTGDQSYKVDYDSNLGAVFLKSKTGRVMHTMIVLHFTSLDGFQSVPLDDPRVLRFCGEYCSQDTMVLMEHRVPTWVPITELLRDLT